MWLNNYLTETVGGGGRIGEDFHCFTTRRKLKIFVVIFLHKLWKTTRKIAKIFILTFQMGRGEGGGGDFILSQRDNS